MKISSLLSFVLIALIPAKSSAGQDWQLNAFDRAHRIFMAYEYRERDLFVSIDPRLADYYALSISMREAEHEMLRYAFRKKLSERPDTIVWSSIWKWTSPLESSEEEKLLAETDAEFAQLRNVFRGRLDAIRQKHELLQLRNKIYNTNSKATNSLEDLFDRELESLQAEVDILRKGG
jgi:hypothetical protein